MKIAHGNRREYIDVNGSYYSIQARLGHLWQCLGRHVTPKCCSQPLLLKEGCVHTTSQASPPTTSNPTAPHQLATLPFASKTVATDINFCNTLYALYSQGQLFLEWQSITVLYSVFSPAKAKGFSDTRIPHHYYYRNTPWYMYRSDWVSFLTSTSVPLTATVYKEFYSNWIKTMPRVGLTMGGLPELNGLLPVDDAHSGVARCF